MLFCPAVSGRRGISLQDAAGRAAEGKKADLLLGGGRDGLYKVVSVRSLTALPPHPPPGSEQSLSTRSPASTWAYVQQLKVIDNQRELSRLSRELEP